MRAFLLQEEECHSARVCVTVDDGNKSTSTAEHNTDDVIWRTVQEIANSTRQASRSLAWVTVL